MAPKWFYWGVRISPGNKLRSRLPGMLADECLYSAGEYGAFFRVDREPTLFGESIVESCLTLRGVEMIYSHSSVESTLVPWRTKQPDCIRQLYIALCPMSPVIDFFCLIREYL